MALWQANHISDALRANGCEAELVIVKTTGDQDQTSRLAQFGGVGVFTKEVQKAVLDGRADLAVHSLKDLPTDPEPGLVLASVPKRAPRADVVAMSTSAGAIATLDDLPQGAKVATGSPRRRAQLLHLRPDIELLEVRGNVETRLQKMDDGLCDAMLLAEAGLTRLSLADRISLVLPPESFLPAVGQGALGLECREDDTETIGQLSQLADAEATTETRAERTVLNQLRAGCHAPLGVWARRMDSDSLTVDAVLLELDGSRRTHVSITGAAADPVAVGIQVAAQLGQTHDKS